MADEYLEEPEEERDGDPYHRWADEALERGLTMTQARSELQINK